MLGRTNTGGGGGGLNFSVVGGTAQPENPKENTIWVNTETEISGWVFSATEPKSPVEGTVWISTGTSSTVEFNALKKDAIQVYPLSAKQYVSGVWVEKTAKTYKNGEWVDWATYLYNAGDACTAITGGWNIAKETNSTTALKTSYILLGYSDDVYSECTISTKNKITFPYKGKKTLKVLVDVSSYVDKNVSPNSFGLATAPALTYLPDEVGYNVYTTYTKTGTNMTYSLDISEVTGQYKVALNCCSKGKIHKIWLE